MQSFSVRLQVDEVVCWDTLSDTLDLDVVLPEHMSVTPEQLGNLLRRVGDIVRAELMKTYPEADVTLCR